MGPGLPLEDVAAAQAPQLDVNPTEVGGAEAPATAPWVLAQHGAVHFTDSGREGVEVIELCRNHEYVRIVLAEGEQRKGMSERSGISDKEETPRGPADGAGSQLELPFGVSLAGLTASGSSSHLPKRRRRRVFAEYE